MNTKTKSKSITSKALVAVTLLAVLGMVITPAAAQVLAWSSDIRLTDDASAARSYKPKIAVDSSDNIHIAWYDKRDGNYEIYYTKLDNNRNTLVDDTRLTDALADSKQPSIAVDSSDNIHIAWLDDRDGSYKLYYTKLNNDGNTLVDDKMLANASMRVYTSIAVDSNDNIHIAFGLYVGSGNEEIYYIKLDNNGNTLVDSTRLTYGDGHSRNPKIAVDSSGNIHIVWSDDSYKVDGHRQIFYTKLDNDGITLVNDIKLVDVQYMYTPLPSIAIDSDDNIHMAWEKTYWIEPLGKFHEIYYTKLDNNGTTLVNDTMLVNQFPAALKPFIAVDSSDNIHIAWYDKRDGNDEIYYTKLDNNGATLVDDTRLTDDPAYSKYPSIAVDASDNIHIAWYDKRDGNYEIYYKRSAIASDITPTAIITPASIFATQSNIIEATIANIGAGSATIFSSFNVSLSADGIPVDTASVDSLSAGASTNVSFSWTPDSPGDYELCVIADSDGAVGESDETNNGLCKGVTVKIPVDIDVKPGTCPNPLNQKSKGVLPVAVLGTAEFDVTTIDPGTILLTREGCEGVAPIRWSYKDVVTPFTGELCDCHDLDGDGYIDLTLKFDTQELVSNLELGEAAGETIPLVLTGNLKEENGGTPIEGKDCIRVQ